MSGLFKYSPYVLVALAALATFMYFQSKTAGTSQQGAASQISIAFDDPDAPQEPQE